MSDGTMAEQLYQAYGEDANWVDYRGHEMPPWDNLPDDEKNHWTAVARQAARMLI